VSAVDDQLASTVERLAFTMRATVLTGSNWTTVAKTGLKCVLYQAPRAAAATGSARTELASRGIFEWERSYELPTGCRITVDKYPGRTWNVLSPTAWPSFGPGGGLVSYTCEVVRAN